MRPRTAVVLVASACIAGFLAVWGTTKCRKKSERDPALTSRPAPTALTPPEMSTTAAVYVHYWGNPRGKLFWSEEWAGYPGPGPQPAALRISLDRTSDLVVYMQLCGLRDISQSGRPRPVGDYESFVEAEHDGQQGEPVGAPGGIPEMYRGGIIGCRIFLVGDWAPMFTMKYRIRSTDGETGWIAGGQWWGFHDPHHVWSKQEAIPGTFTQIWLEIDYTP